MKFAELKNLLEATGVPVAFFHFVESENNPLPEPPYILYLPTYSENYMADNQVYFPIQNFEIGLYTAKKDLTMESILEAVLNDNEIPFETTENFIDSEQLFQKIYEVRLIE